MRAVGNAKCASVPRSPAPVANERIIANSLSDKCQQSHGRVVAMSYKWLSGLNGSSEENGGP
jgi:hypothetical protein